MTTTVDCLLALLILTVGLRDKEISIAREKKGK